MPVLARGWSTLAEYRNSRWKPCRKAGSGNNPETVTWRRDFNFYFHIFGYARLGYDTVDVGTWEPCRQLIALDSSFLLPVLMAAILNLIFGQRRAMSGDVDSVASKSDLRTCRALGVASRHYASH